MAWCSHDDMSGTPDKADDEWPFQGLEKLTPM
jgi:hypothetical protein